MNSDDHPITRCSTQYNKIDFSRWSDKGSPTLAPSGVGKSFPDGSSVMGNITHFHSGFISPVEKGYYLWSPLDRLSIPRRFFGELPAKAKNKKKKEKTKKKKRTYVGFFSRGSLIMCQKKVKEKEEKTQALPWFLKELLDKA